MALNFLSFNQDFSVLGVATSKGFRQYTLEPFSKYFEAKEGDIAMLEMLFSTSLVALVTSPRVLRITNTKRQSTICELTFPTRILALRMNRKRLVVVLESEIYVYDISNMKLLKTIETSPNPNAICALSPSSENNYLAYPLPQKAAPTFQPAHAPPSAATHVAPTSGEVLLFDATKLEAVNVVEAHQAPLSCISLNSEGTLLASASEKGTIVRVFSVPSGEKLFQFRRGSIPARIFCMSFNSTSTLLTVSSATETVHIFRLVNAPPSSFARRRASSTLGDDTNTTRQQQQAIGAPPVSSPADRTSFAEYLSSLSTRERSASPSSEDVRDASAYGVGGAGIDPDASTSSAIDGPSSSPAGPSGERKPLHPTLASMIRRTSQNVGMGIAARVGGYLPKGVTEMWEPQRDFAWVKVPRLSGAAAANTAGPVRTVVAMSGGGPRLMVVSSEGAMYVFNIDLEKGGEGIMEGQYGLIGDEERVMAPSFGSRRSSGIW